MFFKKNEDNYYLIAYAIFYFMFFEEITLCIKRNSDAKDDIFLQTRFADVIDFTYFKYEEGFSWQSYVRATLFY